VAERPRVGYLLDDYVQTSQTFVIEEIRELERQGVTVRIVAFRKGDRAIESPHEVLYLQEVTVRTRHAARAHIRLALRSPYGYGRFLLRTRRVSSEMGFGAREVNWRKIPLVVEHLRGCSHLHAHFAWAGSTLAYLVSPLLGVPWSFTAHANDIFSRQRNLLVKITTADTVVTVCDYNLRWMRENLGLRRRVEIVVCGVVPPAPADRDPCIDIVAVGRLVPKKGFDLLVQAIAQLTRDGRNISAEIVGDGPEREALAALCRELGVSDRVQFLGALPHEEALSRIERARVFCLPARIAPDGDRDSMPVVIKEAMARAVPVVATDVVAIPEMVDSDTGRLVPANDPGELATALAEVIDNPELQARLGAAGRERVLERFTLSGEVAKLRRLLLGTTHITSTTLPGS
jgi:glycosyltransferase involved in cell wall biosynthesis